MGSSIRKRRRSRRRRVQLDGDNMTMTTIIYSLKPVVVYPTVHSPSSATAGVFSTRKGEAHLSTHWLVHFFKRFDANLSNCEQISLQVERSRLFNSNTRGSGAPFSTSSTCSFLRHSVLRMFPLAVVFSASRSIVELLHSCLLRLRKENVVK